MIKFYHAANALHIWNLNNTDWGKRIIEAERCGRFKEIDKELANDWVTCACGKITADIPRNKEMNSPLDDQLDLLGVYFYQHVTNNDFLKAAETLINIEDRAQEVVNEKS